MESPPLPLTPLERTRVNFLSIAIQYGRVLSEEDEQPLHEHHGTHVVQDETAKGGALHSVSSVVAFVANYHTLLSR